MQYEKLGKCCHCQVAMQGRGNAVVDIGMWWNPQASSSSCKASKPCCLLPSRLFVCCCDTYENHWGEGSCPLLREEPVHTSLVTQVDFLGMWHSLWNYMWKYNWKASHFASLSLSFSLCGVSCKCCVKLVYNKYFLEIKKLFLNSPNLKFERPD